MAERVDFHHGGPPNIGKLVVFICVNFVGYLTYFLFALFFSSISSSSSATLLHAASSAFCTRLQHPKMGVIRLWEFLEKEKLSWTW